MRKIPKLGEKVYIVYKTQGLYRVAPTLQTDDGLVLYSGQAINFTSESEAHAYADDLNSQGNTVILEE